MHLTLVGPMRTSLVGPSRLTLVGASELLLVRAIRLSVVGAMGDSRSTLFPECISILELHHDEFGRILSDVFGQVHVPVTAPERARVN